MRRLAPYQSGLWLAEYLNSRCQLCRVTRSDPPLPRSFNKDASGAVGRLTSLSSRYFNKGLLCQRCHEHIMWLPAPFHIDIVAGTSLAIQAASYYEYPLRQAIRAFKHHEDMTKLPLLVHTLRQLPRPHGCHADNSVIIPMPTTNSRLMKRGFDPVTVLCAYLSKHWQILTEKLPVKRLLLFDDVATTGASLQALARTLLAQSTLNSTSTSVITSSIISQSITPLNASISLTHPYNISAYALAHGSQRHQ